MYIECETGAQHHQHRVSNKWFMSMAGLALNNYRARTATAKNENLQTVARMCIRTSIDETTPWNEE